MSRCNEVTRAHRIVPTTLFLLMLPATVCTATAGETAVGRIVLGTAWVTRPATDQLSRSEKIFLEAQIELLLFDQSGARQDIVARHLDQPIKRTLRSDQRWRLSVGGSVEYGDELVTEERGGVEVTFLDGSRLTMGQNSRLTVDEYVYSGPVAPGKQHERYTKGLFRFISGKVPKDNVRIDTPTVTIGIKG